MVANDRHPICISIRKKENVLVLVSAESRNKWLQEVAGSRCSRVVRNHSLHLVALLSSVLALILRQSPYLWYQIPPA